MLILDKDRALDRMIWASGRHAVVVPEQFTHERAPAAVAAAATTGDHAWRWSDAAAAPTALPPRQKATFEPSRSAA
jgi:hypothetical protein